MVGIVWLLGLLFLDEVVVRKTRVALGTALFSVGWAGNVE